VTSPDRPHVRQVGAHPVVYDRSGAGARGHGRDGGLSEGLPLRGAETHLREHGGGILAGFPDHEEGLHDGDVVALGPQ